MAPKSLKKTDAYHHGNLRIALIEAAGQLVQESGIESLTLREVARRAGVSSGAPYHHFKDKAELIQELVWHRFERLEQAYQRALLGQTTPQEKLQAVGVAYVMFAVEHPADFRLMFRPEMGSPFTSNNPACTSVFRTVMQVIDEFQLAAPRREQAAMGVWSLVHGLAALLVDGPLQPLSHDLAQVRALALGVTSLMNLANREGQPMQEETN
ncbi:MAG: TetR/AcrR family transcriptional regulator [Cyanobacteriota bacterium]|nr:TetR/AcrR family transcriptional regulator [Cyanobacteriota bacterium]